MPDGLTIRVVDMQLQYQMNGLYVHLDCEPTEDIISRIIFRARRENAVDSRSGKEVFLITFDPPENPNGLFLDESELRDVLLAEVRKEADYLEALVQWD